MFFYILIGLAGVIAAFLLVVASQPSECSITRTMLMPVPASAVFAQVNDFHKWEAWSPWAKMDPTAKNSFDGAPSGTGATFGWSGNNKVGQGRMTIIESRPGELIRITLEFIKPFPGINDTLFTFKPEGNQTLVTWTMTGKRPFVMRAIGLLLNMDKMVGGQFEQGLAAMKVAAEKATVLA